MIDFLLDFLSVVVFSNLFFIISMVAFFRPTSVVFLFCFLLLLFFFSLNRCLCLTSVCRVSLKVFSFCSPSVWLFVFIVLGCTAESRIVIGSVGVAVSTTETFFHKRLGNVGITNSRNWSRGLNKFPRFNERNVSGELNT